MDETEKMKETERRRSDNGWIIGSESGGIYMETERVERAREMMYRRQSINLVIFHGSPICQIKILIKCSLYIIHFMYTKGYMNINNSLIENIGVQAFDFH